MSDSVGSNPATRLWQNNQKKRKKKSAKRRTLRTFGLKAFHRGFKSAVAAALVKKSRHNRRLFSIDINGVWLCSLLQSRVRRAQFLRMLLYVDRV